MPSRRAERSRSAAGRLGRGTAALLAAALLSTATGACSKIAELDGAAVTTSTPGGSLTAELAAGGRVLHGKALGRSCDNASVSCMLPIEPGALPRRQLQYQLAPGAQWWGTVERQQQCDDGGGATHGEAVKATVHAEVTAADAAGNILLESTVMDVEVSDPEVDSTTVLEFPLGARSTSLFSVSGLYIRPLQPATYAGALITPLPPGEVGLGATWEVRSPGSDDDNVRQFRLSALDGDRFTVEGVSGDWLDPAHTRQQITGATTTIGDLRSPGPISRAIEVEAGVGCFRGTAVGPVRYFVNRTEAPDLDGDGSPG
ncbi:MAG: hypothetical protein AB7O92_00080 [Acidimicrobiia bacterium]